MIFLSQGPQEDRAQTNGFLRHTPLSGTVCTSNCHKVASQILTTLMYVVFINIKANSFFLSANEGHSSLKAQAKYLVTLTFLQQLSGILLNNSPEQMASFYRSHSSV
jgi:hypothetical protein